MKNFTIWVREYGGTMEIPLLQCDNKPEEIRTALFEKAPPRNRKLKLYESVRIQDNRQLSIEF